MTKKKKEKLIKLRNNFTKKAVLRYKRTTTLDIKQGSLAFGKLEWRRVLCPGVDDLGSGGTGGTTQVAGLHPAHLSAVPDQARRVALPLSRNLAAINQDVVSRVHRSIRSKAH